MTDPFDIFKSLTETASDVLRTQTTSQLSESIVKTITASLPIFETATAKVFALLGDQDSVLTWKKRTASQWKNKLANQTDPEMIALLKEYHFGVDYAGGNLLAIEARTVDGTDNSGTQGSNIGLVDLSLILHWRSLIRSDGVTELQIALYPASKSAPRATLIRTNAMFTKSQIGGLAQMLVKILCT